MINSHAKYTVVLKELLNDSEVKTKIDHALSTYPLYQSTSKEEHIPNIIPTREEINRKLLNYYKYREIGFETVGRFIDELQIAMEEIMPYYNQLMFTQDQDFNIIYNVDYVKTIEGERAGTHSNTMTGQNEGTVTSTGTSNIETTSEDTNNTTSTVEGNSKSVNSQTPQDDLGITASNIDSVSYADNVTWNKDQNTSTGESNGSSTGTTDSSDTQETTSSSTNTGNSSGQNNETESMVETTKGNYGQVSYQRLIKSYRDIILNIEQMIINDKRIRELFMMVY